MMCKSPAGAPDVRLHRQEFELESRLHARWNAALTVSVFGKVPLPLHSEQGATSASAPNQDTPGQNANGPQRYCLFLCRLNRPRRTTDVTSAITT
jgi:hypothetical protein